MSSRNRIRRIFKLKALIFLILIAAVGVASAGTYTIHYTHVRSFNDTLNLAFASSVANATVKVSPILDNNGGGTWKYDDKFPITSATTTTAQYCIKIRRGWVNVTNSTGYLKASFYDANFWTYSTGADIRLANQSSQLYFWIEDFNATTKTADIWVNLTTGSTELNLIYGNPSALPSAYNNISKTGLFGDNFSTNTTWNVVGSTTYTIANGILSVDGSSNTGPETGYIYKLTGISDNFVVYTEVMPTAAQASGQRYGIVSRVNATTAGTTSDYKWCTILVDNALLTPNPGFWNLHENIAWESSLAYAWVPNTKYIVEQKISGLTISGKVWEVGTTEPANFQIVDTFTLENKFNTGIGLYVGQGAADFYWIFVASTADPASFGTPAQYTGYIPAATTITVNGDTYTITSPTTNLLSTDFASTTTISFSSPLYSNVMLSFDYLISENVTVHDYGYYYEKNMSVDTTGLTASITLNVSAPLRTSDYFSNITVTPLATYTLINNTNASLIYTSFDLANNTTYNLDLKFGYLIANFTGKDELSGSSLSSIFVNFTGINGYTSKSGSFVKIYGNEVAHGQNELTVEFSAAKYSKRHYIVDLTKLNQSITLYLLADTSSTMITYTITTGSTTLSGAKVVITKLIGDKTVIIDSQYSDASGVVAVPLHAFDTYTITASKPGYATITATITITQSQYTIKLGGINLAIPASRRAVVIFKPSQSTLQPGNNTISVNIIPQGTTITTATITVYVNNTPVASTSKSDISSPTTLSVPVTLNQSSSVSVKVSYTQDGQTVTTQKNYTVPVATGLWATLLLLNNQLNFPGGKTIGLLIAAFITLAVVASLAATTNTNARGLGLIGMIVFTIIALPLGAISISILVVVWVAVIAAWIVWRWI